MTSPETLRVVDDPDHRRYEARLGDRVVGVVEYRLEPGRIVFTHTETDRSLHGEGVGSRLATGVLDDARARGLRVTPVCPFIRGFIDRHPEYRDLLGGAAGPAPTR